MLNMAALNPMPIARVSTATADIAGSRLTRRSARRISVHMRLKPVTARVYARNGLFIRTDATWARMPLRRAL